MAIPYLPPEIITNIFLRLPLKTLSNLRRVNKFCFHLISSPDFATAHLKNSKQDPTFSGHRVIFTTSSYGRSLKQFSFKSLLLRNPSSSSINSCVKNLEYPKNWLRRPGIWLVGSCDGLVCFVLKEKHIFLWNPCTGKYKRLRLLDVDREKCLGITYGFGYDESNDDYKVVALCLYHDEASKDDEGYYSVVNVFSLRGNSWKRIQDFKGAVDDLDLGKLASGKVHWFTSPAYGKISRIDIVSFDVRSEMFGIIELPSNDDGRFERILDVLDGCICLLQYRYEQTHVDLWVMKEYGVKESWTKVVTVSCINAFGEHNGLRPSAMLPNGEILFQSTESFAVYNLKDDSFRFPGIRRLDYSFEPVIYIQSLVSPAGTGRRGMKKAKLVG